MITKEQYLARCQEEYGFSDKCLTDEDFADLQRVEFQDDGIRPISEDEFWTRFQRASGNVVCAICGKLYWRHPREDRVENWGKLAEVRLCNGWFAHL